LTGDINLNGSAVRKAISTGKTAEPQESYGVTVALDPKEYIIRYYCTETGKDD